MIGSGHVGLMGFLPWLTHEGSGIGNLVVLNQFGSMPDKMARANMERFARDVMPELREHVSAVYS